jgi:hypothetical protein
MALYPDYCTEDELKGSIGIPTSDAVDDALIAVVITASSRAIDAECNRQFGVHGSAVARIATWDGRYLEGRQALEIFDVQTTTGLVVATLDTTGTTDTTLTVGDDFHMWPWNAAADGRPWTHLVMRSDAAGHLPARARGVSVTANFGWTSVPDLVKNACLLQAARWYKRKDAPFGVAETPTGAEGFRLLEKLDSDVALSLQSLRRVWAVA